MANLTATLVRNCKTPEGWRRYPAVIGKNGRVRPKWVSVRSREEFFPIGRYEIRKFVGKKTVYVPVGEDATDALLALQKEKQLLAAKNLLADVPSVQLIEEPGRQMLARQLKRFVTAAEDRGSTVAAPAYERTCEEFLLVTGKTFVDQITTDDITDYHKALRKRGMSDRTVHNHHMNVMSFLRYCGLDTKKLAKRAPRYEKTMPEIYEDEELGIFFASLTKPYDRLVFELFLKTGMREQEEMHIEWPDISQTAKVLQLRGKPHYEFKMKDHEQRAVPLEDELLERLKEYHKAHPKTRLIVGTKNGKPNTKLLALLKGCARRAGLNCGHCDSCRKRNECERWFLHRFRATYCTKLLRDGNDLRTVQQMMGHADLASTMRYLRPAENATTRASVNPIKWFDGGAADHPAAPTSAA
ncbi:MAG: site-specific integrase [Edaphobacter sp.]